MPDLTYTPCGTVLLLRAESARAWEFLRALPFAPWQWVGGEVAVEPRPGRDLLAAVAAEGWTVEVGE